jgi:hypothetical protein
MTGLSVKRGKGGGSSGCAASAFSPLSMPISRHSEPEFPGEESPQKGRLRKAIFLNAGPYYLTFILTLNDNKYQYNVVAYRTSAKKSANFQYLRERPSKIDFQKSMFWILKAITSLTLWSNFRQSRCRYEA